jgi:xanthine dehydrogenase accessory factor
VEVLVERLRLDRPGEWPLAGLAAVRDHVARGRRAAVVSRLDAGALGAKLVVLDSGELLGSLGDDAIARAAVRLAQDATSAGRSQTGAAGAARVFVDVFTPADVLVVVGATHLAMSLSALARTLGFQTIVIDGRPLFATAERFPGVDLRVGIPSEILAAMPLTASTALVLAAHDYKYDLPVLRHALTTPVGYIGMLGSRRRGQALLDLLRAEGVGEDAVARVHVPIGLDLGGSTVAEIALAAVAEIVAVARRGTAGRTREPAVP